jgi:hypothetical protein
MGSGGSRSLLPPGKLVGKKKNLFPEKNNNLDKFLMSRVFFVSHYMLRSHQEFFGVIWPSLTGN